MTSAPHSIRHRPQPETLSYEISAQARNRILCGLKIVSDEAHYNSFETVLEYIRGRCHLQYGGICWQPTPFAVSPPSSQQMVHHFQTCSVGWALDFIEWFFESNNYLLDDLGVQGVNKIFREEGIGYELSPFAYIEGGNGKEITAYPQITTKTNDVLHQQTVVPALKVLTDLRFIVANGEMLEALKLYREGKFSKAISACGETLESVFKIICAEKKWQYKPDADTLGVLVKTTKQQQLFFDFYETLFIATGTIRNRVGAHGKATTSYPPVEVAHAEHMIGITCANIVFLAKLAGLA
jgi:hypothetical protein